MNTRPVCSRVHDLKASKGAISATAVMIVVSVALTGLAMDISINTLVDAFDSSNENDAINWFGTTVASNTAELCDTGGDRAVPGASSFSRHIPGLEGITTETDSYQVATGAAVTVTMYELYYELDFGDDTEEITIDAQPNSPIDCDIDFDGEGTGGSVTGLDPSIAYDYRLFSDSEGEVTLQVEMEGDG